MLPTNDGINVKLPDGSTITSTHTALLAIPQLPMAAQRAHIFPALKNKALISIAQLCDHDYVALFNKTSVYILKDDQIIMHGNRHPHTGLYMINLRQSIFSIPTTQTQPQSAAAINCANNAHEQATKPELAQYLHKCCFSPATSTWTKAIANNNFTMWPGLNNELVRKHLPKSLATAKGHLKQQAKNLRLTNAVQPMPHDDPDESTTGTTRTNEVYYKVNKQARFILTKRAVSPSPPVRGTNIS